MAPRNEVNRVQEYQRHLDELAECLKKEYEQSQGCEFLHSREDLVNARAKEISEASVLITNPKSGSGGRIIVTISPTDKNSDLESLVLKSGELLALINISQVEIVFGTIISAKKNLAEISLQEAAESLHLIHKEWKILKLGGHVTFHRMLRGLDLISEDLKPRRRRRQRRGGQRMDLGLLSVLLSPPESRCKPKFDRNVTLDSIEFLSILNDSQKEAVRHCLSAKQFALIHGPPGTGKSYVLVELIRQLASQGKRILVCAASNAAVDNVLEDTVKHKLKCVRLGRQEVHRRQHLKKWLLDSLILTGNIGRIIKRSNIKMSALLMSLSETRATGRINAIQASIRELSDELKGMEKLAAEEVFKDAQVVFSTLNGTGAGLFRNARFDVVIVDEAAQTLEPDCLMAISRGKKLIMAGDHHQLTPVVNYSESKLQTTLFKRLLDNNPDSSRMLNVQYRMHETIMRFVAEVLYDNQLTAHESVANRPLKHLSRSNDPLLKSPLFFIDTAGCKLKEYKDSYTKSIYNKGEVELVDKHVNRLLRGGVKDRKIAIISPYLGQVEELQEKIGKKFPKIEIGTVDGFQGREKEVVILSLVRSNPTNAIGFLDNYRRLNVAITRARSHLCIVGDSRTVFSPTNQKRSLDEKPEFLKSFGAYLNKSAKKILPSHYKNDILYRSRRPETAAT